MIREGTQLLARPGKESLVDEVFRLHQLGVLAWRAYRPRGWQARRPGTRVSPHDFSDGVSPPPQNPHVHGHSGKRAIDLRRKQAEFHRQEQDCLTLLRIQD
ncbi:hypothetical protein Efla_004045 [Eimeria flavescens]